MKLTISTFSELGNLIGTAGMVDSSQEPTNIVDPQAFEADIDSLENELPRRFYSTWQNPETLWINEGL